MSIQYSNVGNPISQALGGLTQYLMIENQRLDQENKEKKINLASELIAERYQQLPPDATIADIQKLQYQLIDDAAALGGLQENLPLLSSLYQSTVATKEYEKAEKRDTALANYIAQRYGVTGDFGGQIAMGLAEFQRAGQLNVPTQTEEGKGVLKIYDDQLKEIGRIETDAAGFETKWQWQKKAMDYEYGQKASLMKMEYGLKNAGMNGTGTTAASYPGFDIIEGTRGQGGVALYKHHKNGGTYYYDTKSNMLKQYWGPLEKVTSKTEMGKIKDSLQALRDTQDTFMPEREGLLTTIGTMGLEVLNDLTDEKLVKDDEGKLNKNTVQQIDNILRTPEGQKKLQEIYADLDEEEQLAVGGYLTQYNTSLSNQMYYQELIKANMPTTEYDGPGLISDTDYEKSSLALNQVFSGQVPNEVSAPLRSYIAQVAGINPQNVNETTFRMLTRREQEQIMKRILPNLSYIK